MKTRIKLFAANETMTRPVIIQVLKNLAKELGTATDPYLYLDDNSNIIKTRNKSGSILKSNDTSAFQAASVSLVESLRVTDFKEIVEEGYEMNRLLLSPDSTPLLLDEEAGIRIQPVMQKRKIEMSIEYITSDKIFLDGLLESLRVLPALNNGQFRHNLEYKVHIPELVTKLILNVYMIKRGVWREDEMIPFSKYIHDIADNRLDMAVPEGGDVKDITLSYREKQMGVFGYFTDELSSIEPEEGDNNDYKISLNYTFTYDKPIAMNLVYPLMVYNKKLHKSFFSFYKQPTRSEWLNYLGADQSLMTEHGLPKKHYGMNFFTKFIKIPFTDDTMPRDYPNEYSRFLTYLFRVDPNDRTEIGTIDDLYKIKFAEPIKELLLKSEREFSGMIHRSIFWFALYENEKLTPKNKIYIDENGMFRTTEPLDIRKRYRLGGFILNNLNFLKPFDLSRIKNFLSRNLAVNLNMASDELSTFYKNKETITKDQLEYYNVKLFEVKNKYVPTLDILTDVYGLTNEEMNIVLDRINDPVEAFFHIMDRRSGFAKTVGIHHSTFNKIINITEEGEDNG